MYICNAVDLRNWILYNTEKGSLYTTLNPKRDWVTKWRSSKSKLKTKEEENPSADSSLTWYCKNTGWQKCLVWNLNCLKYVYPVIHFLSAYITLHKLGPILSPYITFKSNIWASKSPYITFKSNIWAQKWTQIGSNICT